MSFRRRGKSPTSSADHYGNEHTSEMEEPDPALMEKLGIFFGNQRQVKTTTHMHPTLSHSSLVGQNKKSTTSPASTLSDKGIGSSVGSFDAEFRHEPPFLHPSRIPHHPNNKTGSLDSRTHDLSLAQKPMSVHVRSSSDIIGSNGRLAPPPNLAAQSGAALWDSDPRRNSMRDNVMPTSSMTSLIRSRKSSMRRPKPSSESQVKDAEIKKLPQLFRLSPASSAPSSVVSSTHSLAPPVPIKEKSTDKTKISSSVSTSSDVTLPTDDVKQTCNVIINAPTPPTPIDVAPPLPPKTFRFRNPVSRSSSSPTRQNTDGMDHLRIPSSKQIWQHETTEEDFEHSTLSFGRPRVLSDGALHRNPKGTGSTLPRKGSSGLAPHTNIKGPFEGGSLQQKQISDLPQSGFINSAHNTFSRGTGKRSSTRSNPPERRGGNASYRHQLADLQPLNLELPHAVTSEGVLVGREWLFAEMLEALANPACKGVLVSGKSGHGKTAIINHLASESYQGWASGRTRKDHDLIHRASINIMKSSSPMIGRRVLPYGGGSTHSSRTVSPAISLASSRAGSQLSLVEDSCRKLASQVVAFHFCQSDNNTTCYVPEFLHNIASQMSLAPQLAMYREMLTSDAELQKLLTFRHCIINPSLTLEKAIIEPIKELRKKQKLPKSNMIIMIDSVLEANFHRANYGFSILSFLEENLDKFPDFIKLVVTCDGDITPQLPLHIISLDNPCTSIDKDMQLYVTQRISTSEILSTFTLAGKSDSAVAQKQLIQHLMKLARGNFLFLRLCLDLIDRGAIVLKSSGFKVIPVDLNEICLLLCNLNFNSYTLFNELRDVIAVVIASLYPLKDDQIFHAVCCGAGPQQLTWENFNQNISLLSDILVLNLATGRRTFFHPFFKKWFMGPNESERQGKTQFSNRFKTDVKRGHALLATVLSQQPIERLHKHATLELAHHVIQSHMFKDSNTEPESMERSAHLMAECSRTITDALVSPRNIVYPKLKVAELLLQSGADPNTPTSLFANAPPLSVAAHFGYFDFVFLLLAWGAEVNLQSSDGKSPMTYAAASGWVEIVQLLLRYQPVLTQPDDHGYTPLLHAIKHGHSSVAKVLLSRELYPTLDHHLVAAQQALVAASTKDNIVLINYLLDESDFDCDVNFLEPSHGESPLTSAASHGRAGVCELLIRSYHASPHFRNRKGLVPLLCAIRHGQWDAADVLLNCGASMEDRDPDGKSPLIMAACHGHVGLLQLLLTREADPDLEDNEGLTALCWATLQGHVHCVRSLIGYSNLHLCDVHGRRAIDLAVIAGNEQIVDLLLEAGSDVRHSDVSGMSALDIAIQNGNQNMVSKLLRYGAEIQPSSWKLAYGKAEIISVLLRYFLEIGNSLYRKQDFISASNVYANSLKRVGELPHQQSAPMHDVETSDICAHLLLGYSRSMRKLGNLEEAEITVSRALELKPNWFEALYARSRVRRENSRLDDALQDVTAAERKAPSHSLKEIRRLKAKIKAELGIPESPSLPLKSEKEVNQQHHFAENFNHPNLPRITQPNYLQPRDAPYFSGRLIRGNSQESIAESMVSLSIQPPQYLYLKEEDLDHPKRPLPQYQLPYTQQLHRSNSNQNHVIDNRPNTSSEKTNAINCVADSNDEMKFYVTNL